MSAPLDPGRLPVRPVARAGRARAAAALGWSNLIARVRARALARDVGGRPGALAEVIGLLLWAVPESPPRFALPGVIDIVARYDILGHASRDTGNGQNHYSAMPSLHVGLSLWCAYTVWSVLRAGHPRLALLSWMFPLLMAADVLATGNHYVLDVAGSIVLLAASIVAASTWGRLAERRRQARPRRSVPT